MVKNKIDVTDDNINKIMDLINNTLKTFDNYELVKDKVNIILKSVKNNIKNILIIDDNNERYLYVNLYGGFYAFNYDFKNYPIFTFYCQSLRFCNIDCGYVNDEYSDVTFNLHELDLHNFEKIE